MNKETLLSQMKRLGLRITAQRLAVAEVLVTSQDHPTAQEVYERVQARFPHITVGTVYNTINTLAKAGVIQPLAFATGTRYDANASTHANLVCLQCGAIIDAPDEEGLVGRLRDRILERGDFRVSSQRVDFYGLCGQCVQASEPGA